MKRIKQGDDVIVLVGKDKGRRGKVERVMGDRVIVDGVNLIKKHVRGNPQVGDPGGIQSKEASIHISNVALFNPATKKGGRIGYRTDDNGNKIRFFRADDSAVDA
ncbi:MAG: 50S ribosomal protein L24 [Gammaproteobacteria bacterium]|nr:MAG: 50S ribosomal protein L24 [Gammaproteobacteria bacterium]PIE34961.1 MAG: 50S ribosomal protein L24 [Gammaproteobacteria bacterium]